MQGFTLKEKLIINFMILIIAVFALFTITLFIMPMSMNNFIGGL